MTDTIDYWKFLAGLGLFLFAIKLVEEALKTLSGRSFKKLLERHTNNKLKAILVGTLSTSVLQSSSAVTLMLLALVSSGVIAFSNALGIILGANLGTTLTGWIVSSIGFQVNIEESIFPIIAIGSVLYIFFNSQKRISDWGRLLLGFGLLFLGLTFMKDSVSNLQQSFDFANLAQYGNIVFAVAGLLFTSIIQSSSATMVITLTALNAGIITLESSAALIIGADLGSTSTVMLGALAGGFERKRVAAAHFIFNLVTDVIAFLSLPVLISFAIAATGKENPLYALVFFHSSFNILGIFIFWPFLNKFSKLLESRITGKKHDHLFLGIKPQQTNAALEALLIESKKQIQLAITHNRSIFKTSSKKNNLFGSSRTDNYLKFYSRLKSREASLTKYALLIQQEPLDHEESLDIKQAIAAIRNCSMSAKSIKDIVHNLDEFNNSSNNDVHNSYTAFTHFQESFYALLEASIDELFEMALFEELADGLNSAEKQHSEFIQKMNSLISTNKISLKHTSSLFNCNKEIFNSNQFLITAIGDVWLNHQQAEDLSQLAKK